MPHSTSPRGLDAKGLLNGAHRRMVFNRRVRVLAEGLATMLPEQGTVLDIGSGDGSIAVGLMQHRPGLQIEGVEVMIRPASAIPVTAYDGVELPFADGSFDYVTVIDVLHHTLEPAAVLSEAARVARCGIVIKDHLLEGFLAGPTLRFMDWVGNRGHDVVLPYNYLNDRQWQTIYRKAGLVPASQQHQLGIYPPPFGWIFDRRLHFMALLVAAP